MTYWDEDAQPFWDLAQELFTPNQEINIERFWAKVDVGPGLGPYGDCWEWRGACGPGDHGISKFLGTNHPSTHISWWIEHGSWPPKDKVLDHVRCNNPLCVRVDHLQCVTSANNVRRYYAEELKTCKRGHPRVPENLGRRNRCKVCHRQEMFASKRGMTLEEFLCTD